MKKTATVPSKAKQNIRSDEHLMNAINQALVIPNNGELEPDPAIRNRIIAQMNTDKRDWFGALRTIPNLFPVRVPIYQVAFAMAIVLFAVLGIHRKTQLNNVTELQPKSPTEIADTSQTQRDTPRTSSSDTLAQHPIIDMFSAGSRIDSL